MSSVPHRKAIVAGLVGVVLLALLSWLVGREIRSPAQVAADTAPPDASLIAVPVERRRLATEVIVRGTVRYGAPQSVVLPISNIKTGSSIVGTPPRIGAELREGSLVTSISGRPLLVLRGAEPMYRDLLPGAVGPDVRQLEQALQRLGFFVGSADERYDGATEAAVAAWYEDAGWTAFGATETQGDQLRAAEAAAGSARDSLLQARLSQQTATRVATPAEVNQARIDVVTADDAVDAARLAVETARSRQATALSAAARLGAVAAGSPGGARGQADIAAADAEVVSRQAAVNAATDEQAAAQRALDAAPGETTPAEIEALRATLRRAADALDVARRGYDAALSAAAAARALTLETSAQANADAEAARRDARLAGIELSRAREARTTALRQATLARRRVAVLTGTADTSLLGEIVAEAERNLSRAEAEVARLNAISGVQLPADEVLFFPTLPLRVDAVARRRGDSSSGRLMTVSNSQLAADSSLSINDAKLVRAGARAIIEEQDLGIRVPGTVVRVADKPGTNKVDPTRVYFEVRPRSAPARLVGASVRLSIAVSSTKGAVLAVPLSALSVGASGESRIQVLRPGGDPEYLTVRPGLAANGLVEVRPARRGALTAGDLVVVGLAGASGAPTVTDPQPVETTPLTTATEPGAGAATAPSSGTSTGPGTGTSPGRP